MANVKASQMYIWEGKDSNGKRVKGEISGQSEALVKAILRRQKINPTKVKKKPKPLFGSGKSKVIEEFYQLSKKNIKYYQ